MSGDIKEQNQVLYNEEDDDLFNKEVVANHSTSIYGTNIKKDVKKVNNSGRKNNTNWDNNDETIREIEKKFDGILQDSMFKDKGIVVDYYKKNKIPSQVAISMMMIHHADKWKDASTLQKESTAVWNNSLITQEMLRHCVNEQIFLQTFRKIGKSQCKQTPYNFPISPKHINVNKTMIKDDLLKLQANLNSYDNIISTVVKTNAQNQMVSADKAAIDVAKYGCGFLSKVITKANELLEFWSNYSVGVYPCVSNSLYAGNYHDLFAFILLLNLYKDKRQKRNGSEVRDYATDYKKKSADDILEYEKGRPGATYTIKKEPTNPVQGIPGWTGEYDDKGYPIFSKEDDSKGHVFKHGNPSGTGKNKDRTTTTVTETTSSFEFYEEPKYDVVLKPSLNNKLVLITDPALFAHKITGSVAKGISMLCKAGVFPENVFNKLRLCHPGNGLIYKISLIKKGFGYTLDKKYKSFSAMNETQFAQSAFIFDMGLAVRKCKETVDIYNNLKTNMPSCFFTGKPPVQSTSAIDMKYLEDNGFVRSRIMNILYRNYDHLKCLARRHIVKALTDKMLQSYCNQTNKVLLPSSWVVKESRELGKWSEFAKAPQRGQFIPMVDGPTVGVFQTCLAYDKEIIGNVDEAIDTYLETKNSTQTSVPYGNNGEYPAKNSGSLIKNVTYYDFGGYYFPGENDNPENFIMEASETEGMDVVNISRLAFSNADENYYKEVNIITNVKDAMFSIPKKFMTQMYNLGQIIVSVASSVKPSEQHSINEDTHAADLPVLLAAALYGEFSKIQQELTEDLTKYLSHQDFLSTLNKFLTKIKESDIKDQGQEVMGFSIAYIFFVTLGIMGKVYDKIPKPKQ